MSKIGVFVKIPLQPGKREEFIAAFAPMWEQIQGETGTLNYGLFTSDSEPDAVRFFEYYEDKAALDAHMNSDVMKALLGELGNFVSGAPEMVFATAAAGAKNL
jgi:quinol monooxygenase YgiN